MNFVNILKTNLKNIQGKRFLKKILIIECDDWGGIRMPSIDVLKKLQNKGLNLENDRFNNDTLGTTEDLAQLFDILNAIKDQHGRSAVMTPITNVANPDFKKIKQSGFTQYYYEKFTDTLLNYGQGNGVFELWRQGIEAGIFLPELHGREHISVQIWLQKLREGNKDLLFAFDNNFVFLVVPDVHPTVKGFRAEFFFDNETQLPFLKTSIKDAISIFKDIFGYQPKIFVPSNAVFHPIFEDELCASGIRFVYANRSYIYKDENGKTRKKRIITGQKSRTGITYYTRNCAFEPSSKGYKGIEYTLMQVAAAFRWGKPAIISTHRVNFVGGINQFNRTSGLKELEMLLKAVTKRWPDVEFMSSPMALEDYCSSTLFND